MHKCILLLVLRFLCVERIKETIFQSDEERFQLHHFPQSRESKWLFIIPSIERRSFNSWQRGRDVSLRLGAARLEPATVQLRTCDLAKARVKFVQIISTAQGNQIRKNFAIWHFFKITKVAIFSQKQFYCNFCKCI
jgi:hypothetical protein